MSIRALNWAFDVVDHDDLNATLKLVLITLANYADENDETYPKQITIAKKVKLTRQTVCSSLRKLEDLGLVSQTHRYHNDGTQRSSIYRLHVPTQLNSINDCDEPRVSAKPTRGVGETDTGCRRNRHRGVGETDTNNHLDNNHLNLNLSVGSAPTSASDLFGGNNSVDPTTGNKTSKATSRRPKLADSEIDVLFEQRFWPAYPKRIGDRGKPEARKRFRTLVKAGEDVEKIIAASETFAANWAPRLARKPADAKFIPMAATWLNKGRWDDEPEGQAPPGAGGESMIDLANEFERRVRDRESEYGQGSSGRGEFSFIDG